MKRDIPLSGTPTTLTEYNENKSIFGEKANNASNLEPEITPDRYHHGLQKRIALSRGRGRKNPSMKKMPRREHWNSIGRFNEFRLVQYPTAISRNVNHWNLKMLPIAQEITLIWRLIQIAIIPKEASVGLKKRNWRRLGNELANKSHHCYCWAPDRFMKKATVVGRHAKLKR